MQGKSEKQQKRRESSWRRSPQTEPLPPNKTKSFPLLYMSSHHSLLRYGLRKWPPKCPQKGGLGQGERLGEVKTCKMGGGEYPTLKTTCLRPHLSCKPGRGPPKLPRPKTSLSMGQCTRPRPTAPSFTAPRRGNHPAAFRWGKSGPFGRCGCGAPTGNEESKAHGARSFGPAWSARR